MTGKLPNQSVKVVQVVQESGKAVKAEFDDEADKFSGSNAAQKAVCTWLMCFVAEYKIGNEVFLTKFAFLMQTPKSEADQHNRDAKTRTRACKTKLPWLKKKLQDAKPHLRKALVLDAWPLGAFLVHPK